MSKLGASVHSACNDMARGAFARAGRNYHREKLDAEVWND